MTSDKKAQILIVDDNTRNIFSLEQMLSRSDRGFTRATNGKEALKVALNKELDLILLDVQMPVMDGFEVAQILKTNRRTRDVPIIFVSAEKKERESVVKGFEEGAIDYLYKPLDPVITEAKVSALLQQYIQQKELAEKNIALEKYALLINNSADLICTLNGGTLKFEEVNNSVNDVLGYSREEIKGSSLLFYLHEEDKDNVQRIRQERKEKFSFETRVWTKNRTIRLLNWNVVGRDGRWFANARDITGVKEAEEIKSYLAAVVKQSNEAIYLHDAAGRIISWNKGAETIYGFTEDEALKMKIWNIVPEHLLAEAQQVVNNILKGSAVQSVETTRITKKGQIIDVLFSASVLLDTSNNLQSIAITERDITQEKRAAEKIMSLNSDLQKNALKIEETNRELERALSAANQANKELESFSYSVSHDLRAPLRALNGYSQMLEEDFQQTLDEEGRRLLSNIRYNAKRMGMLIDDLLAFSRMGRKEIQRSPVNMREMISEVLNELDDSMTHHAKIDIKELPPAYADRALLRQVWTNLISNALKYSGKAASPRVTIGCLENNTAPGPSPTCEENANLTTTSEYIYFVRDNGVGFNMEYAGKLFGVFQRLHSDEEFEGTGVGLAIVQRVIARHGGRVWAEATPGKGATFYFSLPRILIEEK